MQRIRLEKELDTSLVVLEIILLRPVKKNNDVAYILQELVKAPYTNFWT